MDKSRADLRGICLLKCFSPPFGGEKVQSCFSLKLPQQVHSLQPQVTLMVSSWQLQPLRLWRHFVTSHLMELLLFIF